MTTPQYGLILVTAGSQTEAETIAKTLVEAKLAACVSVFPIRSVYTWKAEIQTDEEWQLLIKTNLEKFPELEQKIQEIHSYEVPEILALPILQGSTAYLQWLAEQVG
ncbi:MAG: divalent-cation tolerance protein CutA [Coleofasciculaceae cyanobacterium SM2_3_26]|nr:divalent-cation tolerance protein CutA [Coleofasciculaceae cyanobacterium SM2_3_26]